METFSTLLALCTGNSLGTGEFPPGPQWIPLTKASDAKPWCFLWSLPEYSWVNNRDAGDLRRHHAHWCWWFETPSCPLWCHCNEVQSWTHVLLCQYILEHLITELKLLQSCAKPSIYHRSRYNSFEIKVSDEPKVFVVVDGPVSWCDVTYWPS